MTVLSMLALLFVLLGPSALLAAHRHIAVGQSLAASLCAQVLFLYVLGLFLPLSWAFYALCALSLACWGAACLRAVRDMRAALRAFLTPGLLFFALAAPLCYYGAINRVFISFDEFSHWGLAVKLMNQTDGLAGNPAAVSWVLYDYPPALTLFEWLACRFLGPREGVALFGYQLLLVSCLLPCADEAGFRRPVRALAALALPLLVLGAIFPMWTLRLFSEPALGLLIALLFYFLIRPHADVRFDAVRSGVLLAFLCLSKNTGAFFAAFYLLAVLCVDRRRTLPYFATLLAAIGSWTAYCAVTGVQNAFSSGIAQNVSALLSGTLPAANATAPMRFLIALFTHPFTQAGIFGTYGMPAPPAYLLAAAAGLCIVGVRSSSGDKRRMHAAMGVLWLLTACYLLFIAFSYLLIFKPYESIKLNEFERYMTTALLMTALPGAMLCLAGTAREGSSVAWMRSARITCAAVIAALALLGNTGLLYETLIARSNVTPMHWQRYMPGELAAIVRANAPDGARVLCIGEGNAIALRYELALEYPVLTPHGDWMDPFSGNADALCAALADCDYVVTFELSEKPAQFAPLLDGEACENSLYLVTREEGGIHLALVAQAPPPPS